MRTVRPLHATRSQEGNHLTISAEILADSINPAGVRLVTWKLTYPRIIHAEFMTHRVFSRNAASSRAIPVKKWVEAVNTNPYVPEWWGQNKAGMQADEAINEADAKAALTVWTRARDHAVQAAEMLDGLKLHKQYANRLTEAFQHITVIASATDYKGFFAQRAHPAAQPEFQALAFKMKMLYESHEPEQLQQREWHLPGVTKDERNEWGEETAQKVSAARMAAVSYLRHEDLRPLDKWMEVWERLVGGDVLHLSPLEHPSMAAGHNARLSNFRGFHQLRARYDPYTEA